MALLVTAIAIIAMTGYYASNRAVGAGGFIITTQHEAAEAETMRGRDEVPADAGFDSDAEEIPALININTATAEELCALPGIGPVIAGRIIEYREETGGYNSIIDLLNVKGIGEKMFENILEYVTVNNQ